MARIRTIKPEFFRHEGLQDLEADNPGSYLMLTFAGLWTQADSKGRFEWKPRLLKLDILPFLAFDMAKTLNLLAEAGHIYTYTADDGKQYGCIASFEKHQRLNTKEIAEGERYPAPKSDERNRDATGTQQGRNRDATGTQPFAQEKEKEKEKEREGRDALENDFFKNENRESDQNSPPRAAPRQYSGGDFISEAGHMELHRTLMDALGQYPTNVAALTQSLGATCSQEQFSDIVAKYAAHHVAKRHNETKPLSAHFAALSKWFQDEARFKPRKETPIVKLPSAPIVREQKEFIL